MTQRTSQSEIVLYKTEDGTVKIDTVFHDETIWLTQKKMAELFFVEVPAISKHLKNIFETNELEEYSVVSKMETTAADGKKYQTKYYNLDAIIAVGYRVNSKRATQFRIKPNELCRNQGRINRYEIQGLLQSSVSFARGRFRLLSSTKNSASSVPPW
jgi:hypothetical protein